jgi:hypothetical protein
VVGRVIERGVDLGKDDTMDINPGVPQDVPGIRQRVMETTEFVLASALPALLWALRAAVFRRLPAKTGLFVDLALILVSVPIAIWLIGRAMNFPADAGDHSPGVGVVFAPLFLVWLLCISIWLVRAQMFAIRRERGRRLAAGAIKTGTPVPPRRSR